MKKLAALVMTLVVAMSLASCASKDARLGGTLKLKWYEFSVQAAAEATSYGGFTPQEGYKLVDVLVEFKSSSDKTTNMSDWEFELHYEGGPALPLDPYDDTMMPNLWELAPKQTATFHLVFEVPAGASGFVLHHNVLDGKKTETYKVTLGIQSTIGASSAA